MKTDFTAMRLSGFSSYQGDPFSACPVVFDLPTGATIVCTFGIVLALMAAVRPFVKRTVMIAPEVR
jgi:hypothetical protein